MLDGDTTMTELTRWIRLGDLAHTRSGDKGDRSNIGVVAIDAAGYAWLETHLTTAAVAEFLRPMGIGRFERYELPGLHCVQLRHRSRTGRWGQPLPSARHSRQSLGMVLLELNVPAPADSASNASGGLLTHEHDPCHPGRSWPGHDPHPESPRSAQCPLAGTGGPITRRHR